MIYGTFPDWWVREPFRNLARFPGGPRSGTSIAALKVYLAISTLAKYTTHRTETSIDDLEAMTGCSRPKVESGIRLLESLALIDVDRSVKPHGYTLSGHASSARLTKVPAELLRKQLRHMPNRGASALAAMKLYVAMLVMRLNPDRTKGIGYYHARVMHTTLQEATGIRPQHVLSGLDHLFTHDLLHRRIERDDEAGAGHPCNVYQLRGRFDKISREFAT